MTDQRRPGSWADQRVSHAPRLEAWCLQTHTTFLLTSDCPSLLHVCHFPFLFLYSVVMIFSGLANLLQATGMQFTVVNAIYTWGLEYLNFCIHHLAPGCFRSSFLPQVYVSQKCPILLILPFHNGLAYCLVLNSVCGDLVLSDWVIWFSNKAYVTYSTKKQNLS